jgi:hypothetical protein
MTAFPLRTARRWRRAAAAALCALLPLIAAGAGAEGLTEAQLRVRFLLNFLRFTEWPPSASPAPAGALNLCVLGPADPFEGALAQLQEAAVGSHKVAARSNVDPAEAADCQLLYVPDGELQRLAGARESIGRRPVLIVGESEAVLDRGGMIALRSKDRHLSFVVNLAPARRVDLGFSPQMLHAAAEVLR